MKTDAHIKTCIKIFVKALFIRVKNQEKKAKHSSLRYTHTIEYYSATEKEQTTDEHNNMGKSPKHYAEKKKETKHQTV